MPGAGIRTALLRLTASLTGVVAQPICGKLGEIVRGTA